MIVNNSTNIIKANNHLSPSLTEPKTVGTTNYDVGISGAGLGQSQKRGGVKSFKRIQTLPSGLPTANTYIKQMIKKPAQILATRLGGKTCLLMTINR